MIRTHGVVAAACLAAVALASGRAQAQGVDCSKRAERYAQLDKMRAQCAQGTVQQQCYAMMDQQKTKLDSLYAQCTDGSGGGAAPGAGGATGAAAIPQAFVNVLQAMQQQQDARDAARQADQQRQQEADAQEAMRKAQEAADEAKAEADRQARLEAKRQAAFQAMKDAFNAAVESDSLETERYCSTSPGLVQAMVGISRYQQICCANPDNSTVGGGPKKAWLTTVASSPTFALNAGTPAYPTIRVEYSTGPDKLDNCRVWKLTTPIRLIARNDSSRRVHLDYGWSASYMPAKGDLASGTVDFGPANTVHVDLPPRSEKEIDRIDGTGIFMRTDTITATPTGSQITTGGGFMSTCTQVGNPGDCGAGQCVDFGAKGKHCTWACSNGCAAPSTGCGAASLCLP